MAHWKQDEPMTKMFGYRIRTKQNITHLVHVTH